jgi:hypothetical protein
MTKSVNEKWDGDTVTRGHHQDIITPNDVSSIHL